MPSVSTVARWCRRGLCHRVRNKQSVLSKSNFVNMHYSLSNCSWKWFITILLLDDDNKMWKNVKKVRQRTRESRHHREEIEIEQRLFYLSIQKFQSEIFKIHGNFKNFQKKKQYRYLHLLPRAFEKLFLRVVLDWVVTLSKSLLYGFSWLMMIRVFSKLMSCC